MLIVFQRYHREICLLLLVVFGLACGHLITTLLGFKLQVDAPEIKSPQATAGVSPKKLAQDDLDFVLRNNLFDPAARGRDLRVTNGSRDNRSAGADLSGLVLFGTVVAGNDSVALIQSDRRIEVFRLDQELPEGGRSESIERNRVFVRQGDGTLAVLSLPEDFTEKINPVAKPAGGSGIVQAGVNSWKVSRRAAESARENIAEQLRLALLEPHISNGKTDGFVIKQLNRRSLLVSMGLLRGDVIKLVNDMKLDSPEKALQILQQLREARRLTVDIERFGKPMTFTYELE